MGELAPKIAGGFIKDVCGGKSGTAKNESDKPNINRRCEHRLSKLRNREEENLGQRYRCMKKPQLKYY